MKESIEELTCDRSADLLSYLYGEIDEHEVRDFEEHLSLCRVCQTDQGSFGQVRASIGSWKVAALSGHTSPSVVMPVREKSAIAALRQFFDLSPLWMKGAVGFAALLFCLLLVLALTKSTAQKVPPQLAEGKFTQHQVNEMVARALREQAAKTANAEQKPNSDIQQKGEEVVQTTAPRRQAPTKRNRSTQWAKRTRPLSKAEQDQLAADLRLLTTRDEDGLNLLGDHINQEF